MSMAVVQPKRHRIWTWEVDEETVGQWEVRSQRLVASYLLDPEAVQAYNAGQSYGYYGGPPSKKFRRDMVQLRPGTWGIVVANRGYFPATVFVEMGWGEPF